MASVHRAVRISDLVDCRLLYFSVRVRFSAFTLLVSVRNGIQPVKNMLYQSSNSLGIRLSLEYFS